jgi:menaquinone-9 beta-reductase
LLRNLALKQGAETLTARVTDLIFDENKTIRGIVAKKGNNLYGIHAQVVIGADGATSTVARKLGLEKHPENQSAVAIRAYINGIKTEHAAEIYLWKAILPGYAWVFPLEDGKANIGVGMRTDKYKETNSDLQNMLDSFVHTLRQKDRIEANFGISEIAQWPLPMAIKFQEQPLAFNGAVLIGDAARIINPITGGGINSGVESAMIAANVIIRLLQKTNDSLTKEQLDDYEKRVKKQIGGTMQKATMAANLIGNYPIIANIATLAGNLPIINDQIAKLFKNL